LQVMNVRHHGRADDAGASSADPLPSSCRHEHAALTRPPKGWIEVSRANGDDHGDEPGDGRLQPANPRTCRPGWRTPPAPSAAPIPTARGRILAAAPGRPHELRRSSPSRPPRPGTNSPTTTGRGNRSRHISGRLRPVAMPSLALSAWMSIAIRFASSTTTAASSRKPRPARHVRREVPGST